MDEKKKLATWGIGIGSLTTILYGMDPAKFTDLLNDALSKQVTQFTIAFGLAAWLHSGRVRKEIANQCAGAVGAINNLASALRQDLQTQSERIGKVEDFNLKMGVRVEKLENKGV